MTNDGYKQTDLHYVHNVLRISLNQIAKHLPDSNVVALLCVVTQVLSSVGGQGEYRAISSRSRRKRSLIYMVALLYFSALFRTLITTFLS
jgi:hypothetical protein